VTAHVKASLASPEAAITAAKDGLQEVHTHISGFCECCFYCFDKPNQLHSTFEFFRDGKMRVMSDAMSFYTEKCHTGVIEGYNVVVVSDVFSESVSCL
jgi:hypothetical protein